MRIACFAAGMMVVLIAGAWVPAAQAADPTPPEVIQNLQQDGATLKYLGDDLGYQGWLAEQNGDAQYFYVSPDGRAIFLGIMFKPDGQAVTFEQLKKVLKKDQPHKPSATTPPIDPTRPGEKFLAAATAARGFEMGVNTAPLMQVFIDPRCPHCKDMMNALWPAIDAGKARVKVIPIGAVARDSQALAAYLLQAPDAPARLKKLMAGDKNAIPTDTNAPTGPVMDNTKLLLDRKLNAVPVTLYRGKDGQVKLIQGPPEDLAAVLADLI